VRESILPEPVQIASNSLYGLLCGPGLFSSGTEHHHRYRKITMPAFATANRIREIIPAFYEVAETVIALLFSAISGSEHQTRRGMG
jgi:cytochrome P450